MIQPMLLPDIVWNLVFLNSIFLRVYFFQIFSQFPSFFRNYIGALIRNPISFRNCLGSTLVHNWTQWFVISMYNIHSESSLLLFLLHWERAFSVARTSAHFVCCYFKNTSIEKTNLIITQGREMSECIHAVLWRLHQTGISDEALSSRQEFRSPPPSQKVK